MCICIGTWYKKKSGFVENMTHISMKDAEDEPEPISKKML